MAYKKNNIFDYLEWRGDLSFTQSHFNEIDALILTVLSYLDYAVIQENEILTLSQVMDRMNVLSEEQKLIGPTMIMPLVIKLADKAAQSTRYKDVCITDYVNKIDEERELQFSAVTFMLSDQTAFLAFRGTDDTLVGWKEDFNMSFATDGVPAQLEAANYADYVAGKTERKFRFGGHSKGGNLAVWAGACLSAKYKDRLLAIYNNDGPGFSEGFLNSLNYISIREKIHSFVPESSIVGVLMEHDDYITISSSSPSLLQHDPFSWMLLGTQFLTKETRSLSGRYFEENVNEWIRSMSVPEREKFVETLYKVLSASNAKTFQELNKMDFKVLIAMDKAFSEIDPQEQEQFKKIIGRLFTLKSDNKKDRKIALKTDGRKKIIKTDENVSLQKTIKK